MARQDFFTRIAFDNQTEIETPALIINLDLLNENIDTMAQFVKSAGCNLRPHFKTHKCPLIARKQLDKGAIGITCAKVGEAEVLANAGIQDILIANQVVQPSKIKKLAGLAGFCSIMVAVDDIENICNLSKAAVNFQTEIGILVEIDIGLGRCGVKARETALALAEKVIDSPGLKFRGIMGYEGHCVFIDSVEERRIKTQEANELLVSFKEYLESHNIGVEIVSGGGTGTYMLSSAFKGITEIQAGSYVFMDTRYNQVEGIPFKNSLFVLATVISKPDERTAVIDAGIKSMTCEFGIPRVICPEGLVIQKVTEEHSIIDISECRISLNVGDRVKIMPSHGCTTANLYDRYYVESCDHITAAWDISARGRSD